MIDEIFDRQYRSGRDQLHSSIEEAFVRLRRSMRDAFATMRDVHYDAPWTRASDDVGCA